MLGDLADQGLPVGLGHVVARLDAALVGEERGEGLLVVGRLRLSRLVGPEVVAVHPPDATTAYDTYRHLCHFGVTLRPAARMGS